MINESEIYEHGSKLVNIFKNGFDKTLDRFLSDNDSTGYVREPCIQASVYTQEPNCPKSFPPNNESLTPLQWLAIFGTPGEDQSSYYMWDVVQSYGADGNGGGDYKDCFFEGPIQGDKGLDYSPVVLACIFDNFQFLEKVNQVINNYTLWDTRYKPLVQNTKKLYQCDVREFKPLQIASLLGSHNVINFLVHDENVYVNQKPDSRDQGRYGSSWAKFNPLTLGIVGFGLPLEDWDPVSRAVRPTRTREEYITSIDSLLDAEDHVTINDPDVNQSVTNWSAMYELIHNAFGKEYTKGSEQDLFNNEVFESFLPTRYSQRINLDTLKPEYILVEDLPWKISAQQVLQGLNKSSNLSTRKKDNPSSISEYEKIRRRMFIYDELLKRRYLLREKIQEIPLKKLIMENVENTFPDMMEYLLASDKYMNRTSIAKDRLKREQKTVDRIKGSEEIGSDARELIKKFISLKGGKKKSRKSKKTKKSRKTKKKGKKSKKKKSN